MKTILSIIALLLCQLASATETRHEYPVSQPYWVHLNRGDAVPIKQGPKYGILLDFPVSPLPDPNASGSWLGYLMLDTKTLRSNAPISGSHLVFQFGVTMTHTAKFNFASDASNTCKDPARVHPIIEYGADRWWSAKAFDLKSMLVGTLEVSLNPDEWYDVIPASAPGNIERFKKAIAKPSRIGVTFGGGCFNGHGVNVSGGTASFNLLRMFTY